ncbi:MAG: signal transduction histidine kinase with CheB and CheR [Betaproteobacteria bacterium]|nr:signal transduction histidine kinase with CheB and CheR [Betaproteobacteria bacterium]
MGASAGGMNALLRFFEHMPGNPGMAFVIILHLAPSHESSAAAILQRSTRLKVLQVTGREAIKPDHVYVIPPGHDLGMDDGHLRLIKPERVSGPHTAIDLFFRTLAEAHRERAFCIVLSGTGADGSVGLTRVKEVGGVTFAQLPGDAEYEGMPAAAIATGMVDIVLPAAEIPQRLLDLWGNARHITLPPDAGVPNIGVPSGAQAIAAAEQALGDVMGILRGATRHDFRHYKRATVLRRIERRLQVNGLPDLPAYRDYLGGHPEEIPLLLKDMLIGVTNFFRDREAFEALEREVLPGMFEQRDIEDPARVWVAGCATGEEAYSVAMLLREQAEHASGAPEIQVFATDIDEPAIAFGRGGLYPESIITDVSPGRLRNFFVKEEDHYRIAKVVRERVLFAAHNLLRDPPFSRLDLICCRNLLIYLDREAQKNILEMFRFALKPNGHLFLGTSESAEAADNTFIAVDKKNRIFKINPGAKVSRHLPLSASSAFESRSALPRELREERRHLSYAEMHQRMLERYAPPSLLLDAHQNVLHLADGVGRFMEHGAGVPSHNLLGNVHPDLRLELRTALFKAEKSGGTAQARDVPLNRDGSLMHVTITVQRFRDAASAADLTLVVFEERPPEPADAAAAGGDARHDPMVARLEEEIRELKAHLLETVQRNDTSNEDLKASNEELQAINEELRSASEELETSKEELQSMNEELVTVNFELKSKVEETGRINDDLKNLMASTEIATVFIDAGVRIQRFTPHAVQVFNLIASDIGRSLLDITHRLDYPELADDAHQAFQTLRMIERPVDSTDGRHYLARVLPYRTADNKIDGAVLTFIDVTALRNAEDEVKSGIERLRVAAETTRDYAILTTDEAGIITTWNEGALRVFGYTEEEALGQPVGIIFTAEDRARGVPEAEMRRARDSGSADDDRWMQRKDGSTFYCSGVMSVLQSGALTGFSKIARDMTGSKQHETAREALLAQEQSLRQQARLASEMKDEFLAVMSHELRHPLNLIHVNAELLVRMPEINAVPAVTRVAETIRRAVVSQSKIIEDLLDLTRARTGKLTLNIEAVTLSEIAGQITNAAQGDAREKGLTLEFVCEEEGLVVDCDPVRAEQIIWNLVSNALKFTPKGGSVKVALKRDTGFAHLSVADSGRGIGAEFIRNVFGMFTQESRERGANTGMGIGLALVEELTQAQGGWVRAESPGVGLGASFHVWLPLHDMPRTGLVLSPYAHALRGLRILAVDDVPDALVPFAELLRMDGAIVTTAENGLGALGLLETQPFDLLVADIGMPVMDGYALIAEVRKRERIAQIPAIAVTGFGRPIDVQLALEHGYDAHIAKPVPLDTLRQTAAGLVRGAAPPLGDAAPA